MSAAHTHDHEMHNEQRPHCPGCGTAFCKVCGTYGDHLSTEPHPRPVGAAMSEVEAIAEVLAAHYLITGHNNYEGRGSGYVCLCGDHQTNVPDSDYIRLHADHVASILAARLAAADRDTALDPDGWTVGPNREPVQWVGSRLIHPARPTLCIHHVSLGPGFACYGCSNLLTHRAADRDTALREAVSDLADEARDRKRAFPSHPHWAAWDLYEADLRTALDQGHTGGDEGGGT